MFPWAFHQTLCVHFKISKIENIWSFRRERSSKNLREKNQYRIRKRQRENFSLSLLFDFINIGNGTKIECSFIYSLFDFDFASANVKLQGFRGM